MHLSRHVAYIMMEKKLLGHRRPKGIAWVRNIREAPGFFFFFFFCVINVERPLILREKMDPNWRCRVMCMDVWMHLSRVHGMSSFIHPDDPVWTISSADGYRHYETRPTPDSYTQRRECCIYRLCIKVCAELPAAAKQSGQTFFGFRRRAESQASVAFLGINHRIILFGVQ